MTKGTTYKQISVEVSVWEEVFQRVLDHKRNNPAYSMKRFTEEALKAKLSSEASPQAA